jgi:predicted nucleic acid-binding protein
MLVGRYLAFLDANVLHPAFLRAALLWFAQERLFRPAWSTGVIDEWRGSVKARFPDVTDANLDAMQSVMSDSYPDALVTGYERITPCLDLPDPDDNHVLAAAIVGKCHGIVTANIKHFPVDKISDFTLEIIHPDDFIVNIIDLDRSRALTACRAHRAAMHRSAPTPDQFLDRYLAAGLVQAHARLSEDKELL